MSAKVSIIVPVYNVEPYIPRCIDSIMCQSFTDFELLLVDDGSTDGSGKICDAYAEKDSRIRVFHKENRGVSSARNLGLDEAKGEWVYFMDPDDEIVSDALLCLVKGINEEVDVVMGGYDEIGLDGKLVNSMKPHSERLLDRKESLRPLFSPYSSDYAPYNGYVGYVWIRLFRLSVIHDHRLRFDESIKLRECTLFLVSFLCASRGTTMDIGRVVYRYYRNDNSITRRVINHYDRNYITYLDSFDANVKMVHLIEGLDSCDSEILKCAKVEVMDRYRQTKKKMIDFGVKDDNALRELRKKCIKELGIPFLSVYLFDWSKKKVAKKAKKMWEK